MKWNDDDLDLALGGLRDDDQIPEAALTAIRARVMEQLPARHGRWWRWAWVPVVAAALVAVAVIPRQQPIIEPPPLIARAPAAQPMQAAPKPVFKPALKPAQPKPETEFARIMTDDPDVVILWAMNSEGDTQ